MDQQDFKADALRLGAHAALMRELRQTPMWACYVEYIEQMLEDSMNRVLAGTKEEFDLRKGIVMGLRDAIRVPDNIIVWAERSARN